MINLHDILKATNGQLIGEPAAHIFKELSFDPDAVGASSLFVGMRERGLNTHRLIADAIASGATGIICSEPPNCDTAGVSVLLVDDAVDALNQWARFVLNRFGTKIIGVTGSAGIAASVRAITQAMRLRFAVHEGVSDGPPRLLLPLSVVNLTNDTDYVVVPFVMDAPGHMATVLDNIGLDSLFVTSLDCFHPSDFASCEHLIAECRTLIGAVRYGGHLILNYDDEQVAALGSPNTGRTSTVSINQFGADYMMFNVTANAQRVGFDLRHESERFIGQWTPLLGIEHLYGLLAAVAIGADCSIPIQDILNRFKKTDTLPGHMQPLMGKHATTVLDDTAGSSLVSVLNALEWMKIIRQDEQRVVAVLGDLADIDHRNMLAHRLVGERAAEAVDVLITIGTKAAMAARAAVDYGMRSDKVITTFSAADAVHYVEALRPGAADLILVKGGVDAGIEQVMVNLLANPADRTRLTRQTRGAATMRDLPLRPSRIELDVQQLARNVRILRRYLAQDVTLMAVVKANAYGHGAVMAARTAIANGAGYLGVASMEEALELRAASVATPVLVLSYTPVSATHEAVRQDLTVTLYDLEMARQYNRLARMTGKMLKCHVKVDTGMGRLGILPDEVPDFFRHLNVMKSLQIEGIYTHFSSADEDAAYTQQQIDTFRQVVRQLQRDGTQFKYIHAANSAGMLRSEAAHFNMVRAGLAMYGLKPAPDMPLPDGMAPLLSWKTTVLQVKTLPPGHPVGYGNTYHTNDTERIAILPVGYADGLRRSPHTWQHVLIHGQRAPLVGRVSMEKTAVNVSHIPDVQNGDEVVLIGTQGNERITPDDVAGWLHTINYEVITSILPRADRRG